MAIDAQNYLLSITLAKCGETHNDAVYGERKVNLQKYTEYHYKYVTFQAVVLHLNKIIEFSWRNHHNLLR